MSTVEQLSIFLYAITTELTLRKLAEQFQCSQDTIMQTYHKILQHFRNINLQRLYTKNISYTSASFVQEYVQERDDVFPWF